MKNGDENILVHQVGSESENLSEEQKNYYFKN